ncbi:MAG: MFS transporter [Cyanobacteria bacterium CRU_2_1]|nr:MFS transporter [Cyanobacteria bacterium RU_5_0]NJR59584.1 MFS transporter [Cyanobacteria bacterium CRU_2_1]
MKTTNQIALSQLQQPIVWISVAALAAVYGSFTLSWVIYRVHLAGLVTQAGFSEAFAPVLLLIEAIVAIVIEPWAGWFSDQIQQQKGTRFPIISLGVILSSALFVAIPVGAPLVGSMRWIIPSLLIAWAITTNLFRCPALALLRRYAPMSQLPQAASLLTLMFGLVGAVAPFGNQLIKSLGAPMTFVFAAILTVMSAVWLKVSNPPIVSLEENVDRSNQQVSIVHLALIFITGLGVILAFRLAIETFPKLLTAQLDSIHPPMIIGAMFLTLAIAAFPAGKLAVYLGNTKTMLIGLGAVAVFLGLMPLVFSDSFALIVAIGLGIAFSLIINGTLPFTLDLVFPKNTGLGVGLFFGGADAAHSLYAGVLNQSDRFSPMTAILAGIVALLIAGICIIVSKPTH